jgi:cytochrome P450
MINIIIATALDSMKKWDELKPEDTINIVPESLNLITNCIQACIFGMTKLDTTLEFNESNGEVKVLGIGEYLNSLVKQQTMFVMMPHRLFFDVFDDMYMGKGEKTLLKNIIKFREFIRDMIHERRAQMKNNKDFLDTHTDFLTILLMDELFSTSDEFIIDECITFMLAGTQTSSNLFSNNTYNVIRFPEMKQKIRDVTTSVLGINKLRPSKEEWFEALT